MPYFKQLFFLYFDPPLAFKKKSGGEATFSASMDQPPLAGPHNWDQTVKLGSADMNMNQVSVTPLLISCL